MKIMPNTPAVHTLAYRLVSIICIVYIAYLLQDILIPLAFAALISLLLVPFCNYLESKKCPRVLAIILALLLVLSILILIFYLAVNQILGLENLIPVFSQKINTWITEFQGVLLTNFRIDQTRILSEGQKYISDILKNGSTFISNILGFTSSFLVKLSLLPLYIFLFLLYRDFLQLFLFKLLKNTHKQQILISVNKIVEIVGHYLSGLIKVILIVGILNSLALYILGIDHAFFFGFFAAVLVLIPYIGIIIGALLPIFVALVTKDSYLPALGVGISFYVVQFLEGNFITPKVVGTNVSINSLVAIVALLLLGKLWGMAGLVLALPITAVLKVIFDSSESTKAWGFLLGDSDRT